VALMEVSERLGAGVGALLLGVRWHLVGLVARGAGVPRVWPAPPGVEIVSAVRHMITASSPLSR